MTTEYSYGNIFMYHWKSTQILNNIYLSSNGMFFNVSQGNIYNIPGSSNILVRDWLGAHRGHLKFYLVLTITYPSAKILLDPGATLNNRPRGNFGFILK